MIPSPVIGVDIGGSHAWAAQFDQDCYACQEATISTREVDNKAPASDILDNWHYAIVSTALVANKTAKFIGLSLPGPFDYENGVGLYKGNDKYEALNGIDVKDELESRLPDAAEFRFINDAAGFGIGCALQHDVRNRRLMAVTLGTGFGATFVDNAIPLTRGLGVPQGGELWCLPCEDGIADDYISTRWFTRTALDRLGCNVSGAEDVAKLAAHNDIAREIFEEFGLRLGNVLLPWLREFSPDLLVLGGRISMASSLFLPVLERALQDEGLNIHILLEPNTEMLAAMGGAALFDESIWSRIKAQ